MSVTDLTPVEEHGGILFKRDDLYAPYGEDWITGGKIRQCRHLIETNLDYIKSECGGTIATASSIASPQAPIVSMVAKEFGLESIIGYGNSKNPYKQKAMTECRDLGSEMVQLSETQGFNNVLYHNLQKLAKERPMFQVLFGYAAQTHRESIIGQIAEQVQNVECDVLYVPMGSAITFTGILEGMTQYDKKFKIVGLQPFGYDRTKSVYTNLSGFQTEYDFTQVLGNYNYHKLVKKNVGFELDMIYESKSYLMMEEEMNPELNNCFWVIGNSNSIR
jgi:1-aminocyclopropane-1-carboxylate deaminase/D-cysteine desulfhydrase-like pyridoxal-dependent ACC family enzyme